MYLLVCVGNVRVSPGVCALVCGGNVCVCVFWCVWVMSVCVSPGVCALVCVGNVCVCVSWRVWVMYVCVSPGVCGQCMCVCLLVCVVMSVCVLSRECVVSSLERQRETERAETQRTIRDLQLKVLKKHHSASAPLFCI